MSFNVLVKNMIEVIKILFKEKFRYYKNEINDLFKKKKIEIIFLG